MRHLKDVTDLSLGSGRVTFEHRKSYEAAVRAAFIEIKTAKFTKKVSRCQLYSAYLAWGDWRLSARLRLAIEQEFLMEIKKSSEWL